ANIFLISFFIFLGAFGIFAKARSVPGSKLQWEKDMIIVVNFEREYKSPPPSPKRSPTRPTTNLRSPPVPYSSSS
ncbi:hypothetical protein GIB67_034548, partial [Kingdonia uniflora]